MRQIWKIALVVWAFLFTARCSGLAADPTVAPTAAPTGTLSLPPTVEREALAALYKATGGQNWDISTGWLSDQPVCSWYGIKCAYGHVIQLDLRGNRLQGSIPPEIGQLADLEYLDISDNSLTSLPPEIARIPVLRLACNAFVELAPEVEAIVIAEENSISSHWGGILPCRGYAGPGNNYIPAGATPSSLPSN